LCLLVNVFEFGCEGEKLNHATAGSELAPALQNFLDRRFAMESIVFVACLSNLLRMKKPSFCFVATSTTSAIRDRWFPAFAQTIEHSDAISLFARFAKVLSR